MTGDHGETRRICDGPNPGATRQAVSPSGLPLDSVTPVTVLDP